MSRLRDLGTELGWRYRPARMIARSAPEFDPELERVYLDRGVILIHIPKNAGSSVEEALYGHHVRHRPWYEIERTCPRAWAACRKIAVIRDPVDRFLSAYDYLGSGGRNAADRMFGRHVIAGRPVDDFIDRLATRPKFRAAAMGYFHFRPQSDFVSRDGVAMVDHLIPFHRLAEGLARFAGLRETAIRHANRTGGARTDPASLSQASRDRLSNLYAEDEALYREVCAEWDAAPASGS